MSPRRRSKHPGTLQREKLKRRRNREREQGIDPNDAAAQWLEEQGAADCAHVWATIVPLNAPAFLLCLRCDTRRRPT